MEPRDVNIAAETAGSSGAGGSATKIFTDLELHRQRVRFQLDTGASCNVIGRHMLPPEAHLKPTNKVLSLYDHSTVAPMGIHTTYVRNPKTGTQHCLDLVVVQSAKATPLLGAKACQEMKLVIVCHDNIQDNSQTINSALHTTAIMSRSTITPAAKENHEQYADVLDGELGRFEGVAHLAVDNNVTPVRLPLRKVPLALQRPLEEELDRLEKMGVIVRGYRPTDWLSSLVVVPKTSGKIRL